MKVIRTSTKLIRDDIINKGIGKILGVLNSKRVSQLYDAVCMFLSTGALLTSQAQKSQAMFMTLGET